MSGKWEWVDATLRNTELETRSTGLPSLSSFLYSLPITLLPEVLHQAFPHDLDWTFYQGYGKISKEHCESRVTLP